MKPLSPFFKYFGSKRNSAWKYPRPRYRTIVEPFAGGAGYSLNYWDRDVVLFDADPRVIAIWKYLIGATPKDILAIPLLEFQQPIESLDVSDGAKLLLSCLVNTSPFRKCMSGWFGRKETGFWSVNTRSKIARQIHAINHWHAEVASYEDVAQIEATHFVDPPYVKLANHYAASKERPIDFCHLGQWCQSLPGQVIVCEQEGADWLPFSYLGQAAATRNKSTAPGRKSKKCCEAIWTNEPLKQTTIFDRLNQETPCPND